MNNYEIVLLFRCHHSSLCLTLLHVLKYLLWNKAKKLDLLVPYFKLAQSRDPVDSFITILFQTKKEITGNMKILLSKKLCKKFYSLNCKRFCVIKFLCRKEHRIYSTTKWRGRFFSSAIRKLQVWEWRKIIVNFWLCCRTQEKVITRYCEKLGNLGQIRQVN